MNNTNTICWVAIALVALVVVLSFLRQGDTSRYSFHQSEARDYIFDKQTGKLYWKNTDSCAEEDLITGERTWRKLKTIRK